MFHSLHGSLKSRSRELELLSPHQSGSRESRVDNSRWLNRSRQCPLSRLVEARQQIKEQEQEQRSGLLAEKLAVSLSAGSNSQH
jgi:hypothetical protein